MQSHGISLDLRHILLAADTMTFKGKILGFTRHGVSKLKNSTLSVRGMMGRKLFNIFY